MCQIIIGMQTLLWVENYNCFSDQATIPLSAIILLVCFVTHKVCMLFGRCFGVWKIDEVIERVTEKEEEGDDFFYLIERINAMKHEDAPFIDEEVPEHLRF